ncbi:MAG TPA: DUF885 family protein, partial [Urbifossiella sp.]|nr:DUF885 family protein [Urbifossiella sp.]
MSRFAPVLPVLLGTALMATPAAQPPAAATPPPAATAEDTRLANYFRTYLEDEFKRHPVYATQQGNHDHDDRMDDLSPAARAKDAEIARWVLADVKKEIAFDKLSRTGQIDYEIFTHSLDYSLWSVANDNRFEFDPRVYGEFISDSVFLLFTQSTLPRERNVQNAAKRIAEIPKVVAAAKAGLKNPPKILTEITIRRNKGAIAFYEKDVWEFARETPGSEPLATPCRAAVAALKDYQTWLEQDLLPRSAGEWRLGAEKFARKLALELDAGLTAAEVLALAEAEADRVEREMYYVAKQLWAKLFPGRPVPPDDPAGRRDTTAHVLGELGKDHGKPEDLLADVRKTVDGIRTFIREKKILTLPDPDTCKIVEMPEFQRGFSA